MRRSSSTHAVLCAAGAFILSSLVLGNLISGGSGLTVAGGMVDSSLTASLFSINSSYCLLISCLPTHVPLRQTSSDFLPSSLAGFCLLLKWKMLSSSVMFPNVSCMTPFRQLIMAFDVAKNGLPNIMGT